MRVTRVTGSDGRFRTSCLVDDPKRFEGSTNASRLPPIDVDGASMTLGAATANRAACLTQRGRRAERVNERGMNPPASVAEYAGTYESDEPGIAYPIAVRKDALALQSRQYSDIALTHRWRDEIGGADPFRSVESQRCKAGKVVGLMVNIDERSRNIHFTRRK